MPVDYQLIEITDQRGLVLEPQWLANAQGVHRQLRPDLPQAYVATMTEVFAHGGRMTVAVRDDVVVAIAVYRTLVNTAQGKALYVDDLVTDSARRSTGAGKALLDWCACRASALGCAWLTLDSGTQRHAAHRFYFRERMHVSSFHFVRKLGA